MMTRINSSWTGSIPWMSRVGRALTRHLEFFGAVENLFNQRYQVARTPVINLGPPILFRVGVRLNYPQR